MNRSSKWKRILAALLSAFLAVSAPFAAYAHPGRTDSSGGHHDYGNVSGLGDYHYHHGYPAHLHPNGVCPYAGADSSSSPAAAAASDRYDEGYDAGYKVGYDEGKDAGFQSGYSTGTKNVEDYKKRDLQEANGKFFFLAVFSGISLTVMFVITVTASVMRSKFRNLSERQEREINSLNARLEDVSNGYDVLLRQSEENEKEAKKCRAERQQMLKLLNSRTEEYNDVVTRCNQYIALFGKNAEDFFKNENAEDRLSKMQADYLTLVYAASSEYLDHKQRPAHTEALRIRELKCKTEYWIDYAKHLEYENDRLKAQIKQLPSPPARSTDQPPKQTESGQLIFPLTPEK